MPRHIPSGQLFITSDFKLSAYPQSQYGVRNSMSAANYVKRKSNKTVGKQVEEVPSSPKLAKLAPLVLPPVDLSEDSDSEHGQPPQDPASSTTDEASYVEDCYKKTLAQDVDDLEPPVLWPREHVQKMSKAKHNNFSALICLLMHQLIIPLTNYKKAHQLYKTTSNSMTKQMKDVIFKILSLWGITLANKRIGLEYLMDFVDCEDLRNSLSMIVFPAKMCRMVNDWLKTFSTDSMELPDPESIATELSASQPCMLPNPEVLEAHTSTSYTPVLGINHTAGVLGSGNFQNLPDGNVVPANLTKYKMKTSKNLSTISFNQGEFRCTLRSPNNTGDLAVKMEVYNYKDIIGKKPVDYWRYATAKGFVLCRKESKMGDLAAQLQTGVGANLEFQM